MQNLSEENFKQKYLKYKTKYLNLKNKGGSSSGNCNFYYLRNPGYKTYSEYETILQNSSFYKKYNDIMNSKCDGTISCTILCRKINSAIDDLISYYNNNISYGDICNKKPQIDVINKYAINLEKKREEFKCMRIM